MANLGDIFKITSGGTPSKKHPEYYENGAIPWIKTGDLKGKYISEDVEFISELGLKNSSAKIFPPDTVLLAMYGATIGACSILPFSATTNQACAAFLPTEEIIPSYLYYYLCSKRSKFIKDGVGGAQPNLSAGYLKKVQIPVLTIGEQEKIATILDYLCNLIEWRKKQLERLNQLIKSQFIEMFGDPVFNPFGFEQSTLKNISKTKLSYGSGAAAVSYDGETRYVRITDITDNGSLNNDFKSPASVDEKYLLNDGDILFARTGATVGKTFEYKKEYGRCIYAGFLIRLVPDTTKVLPSYVYAFTQSAYYKKFIAETQRVVAQPNINAQEYGDLIICVPPLEKQREFEKLVQQADKSKFEIQQSIDKLETLKKSLMQEYFG